MQSYFIGTGDSKVHKRRVFMGFCDAMRVHIGRRKDRFYAFVRDRRLRGQHPDFKPAFFFNFPVKRYLGIFVKLYMSADRKPFVILLMVNEQDFVLMNYKDGNNKIVELM